MSTMGANRFGQTFVTTPYEYGNQEVLGLQGVIVRFQQRLDHLQIHTARWWMFSLQRARSFPCLKYDW